MVTKGYAASEVHEAFLRALELCEERGETHRRAPVLLGLWRFYNTRAEFQKAYDLGEEFLILAMNIQNPAFHLEAYYAASITAPATLHPFSLPPHSSRRAEGSRGDFHGGQNRCKHRPRFLPEKPLRGSRPICAREEKVVNGRQTATLSGSIEPSQLMVPQ